jgi:3-methyladenine DNA glycosylase AlkC
MAEPLIAQYGPDVPQAIARMVAAVHPRFDVDAFLQDALTGYEALALMPRGKHIARALHRHLPPDYGDALRILLASADQPHGRAPGLSLASFLFLPHTVFVSEFGLDHFELSMQAQHALTQRFTAEFSIRPFLQKHTEATLERLADWATDPSEHVRRLVSEGTRPRLPWASRLPAFQRDPAPVLALLERLKDDPALYVRRSVANKPERHRQGPPGCACRHGEYLAARRDARAALDCATRVALGGQTWRAGCAGGARLWCIS